MPGFQAAPAGAGHVGRAGLGGPHVVGDGQAGPGTGDDGRAGFAVRQGGGALPEGHAGLQLHGGIDAQQGRIQAAAGGLGAGDGGADAARHAQAGALHGGARGIHAADGVHQAAVVAGIRRHSEAAEAGAETADVGVRQDDAVRGGGHGLPTIPAAHADEQVRQVGLGVAGIAGFFLAGDAAVHGVIGEVGDDLRTHHLAAGVPHGLPAGRRGVLDDAARGDAERVVIFRADDEVLGLGAAHEDVVAGQVPQVRLVVAEALVLAGEVVEGAVGQQVPLRGRQQGLGLVVDHGLAEQLGGGGQHAEVAQVDVGDDAVLAVQLVALGVLGLEAQGVTHDGAPTVRGPGGQGVASAGHQGGGGHAEGLVEEDVVVVVLLRRVEREVGAVALGRAQEVQAGHGLGQDLGLAAVGRLGAQPGPHEELGLVGVLAQVRVGRDGLQRVGLAGLRHLNLEDRRDLRQGRLGVGVLGHRAADREEGGGGIRRGQQPGSEEEKGGGAADHGGEPASAPSPPGKGADRRWSHRATAGGCFSGAGSGRARLADRRRSPGTPPGCWTRRSGPPPEP